VRFGSNGGRGGHRKVSVSTWKPVGESIGLQSLECWLDKLDAFKPARRAAANRSADK